MCGLQSLYLAPSDTFQQLGAPGLLGDWDRLDFEFRVEKILRRKLIKPQLPPFRGRLDAWVAGAVPAISASLG